MLQLSCSPSVLLLKRQLLVCPGKKKKKSQSSALQKWHWGDEGQVTLPPQPLGATCQHLGRLLWGSKTPPVCCQNSPYLLCISSGDYSWGSSEKRFLQRPGWPLGRLMGSSREAKKHRWGARLGGVGGGPFPAHPNRRTPWLERPESKRTPSPPGLRGIPRKSLIRERGHHCVKLEQFRWGLYGYSELLYFGSAFMF